MTTAQFTRLAQFGTLWRPATAAYGSPPGLYVNCDRCRATHLPACFHDGSLDLCVQCAHQLLVAAAAPAASAPPAVSINPAPMPAPLSDHARTLSGNPNRLFYSAQRAFEDPYLESTALKAFASRPIHAHSESSEEDLSVDSASPDFEAGVRASMAQFDVAGDFADAVRPMAVAGMR